MDCVLIDLRIYEKMKYMMEAYGGPPLSKRKEVSPSLQARRPFMHREDSYPFLIDCVLIDMRI